jgi:hypothetical protein
MGTMVAFSTVKVGDVLYDCRRQRMGNTTMSRMETWLVRVIEVDAEKRRALVSWNSNAPRWTDERDLKSYRRSRPVQL